MKWKDIVEQFPKSYYALCTHRIGDDWEAEGWTLRLEHFAFKGISVIDPEGDWVGPLVKRDEELYDFFDHHNLLMTVAPTSQEVSMSGVQYFWGYGMSGYNVGISRLLYGRFESRAKAQEAAFMKAFAILEEILSVPVVQR